MSIRLSRRADLPATHMTIDLAQQVASAPDPKGDRVKIEMSGKYLAYNAW